MSRVSLSGKQDAGGGWSPYVIAEIGTNHNRDLDTARALVRAVAATGCDAAKFQIYEPDEIVSGAVRTADYGLDGLYGDISAQEMFGRYLQTPKAWFPELRDLCHEAGIGCGVTIHGEHGREWAKRIGFDFLKIASMDHTNLPFLASLVNTVDVPILISFGMAGLADIDAAVDVLRPHRPGIGLFHCVAIYPPTADELRLGNIPFIHARYGLPVGFSDHTDDVETGLAAVTYGATFFEKHVTLDRGQPGPDHPFALEMDALTRYVAGLAGATKLPPRDLQAGAFLEPSARETAKRASYLKSMIARRDLPQGHTLTGHDVYLARPGTGISPAQLEQALGRRLARPVKAETPLLWDDLASA
jgi:N,N'-diacetyllegionaminate synthase